MALLRHPEKGCPWDLKQDFNSLTPFTIEEAYEVADAIERNDLEDLRSELGDLLLQVVFHSQLAEEQGLFNFEQVAETITDKLIHRHPHVFENVKFKNDEERQQAWEQAKEKEQKAKNKQFENSVLSGVPINLPALIHCEKIQVKAANHGFDWPEVDPVFDKVMEELDEAKEAWLSGDQDHVQEEIGDLLLVAVNLARHLKVNPELALKQATQKFIKRFNFIEEQVEASGRTLRDCELDQLDAYWDEAKLVLKTKSKL